MSNIIRMESLFLNTTKTQTVTVVNCAKNTIVQGSEKEQDNVGDSVAISNAGREKARQLAEDAKKTKIAGVSSTRELYECQNLKDRDDKRWNGDPMKLMNHIEEVMRQDEPETYAKYQELKEKYRNALRKTECEFDNQMEYYYSEDSSWRETEESRNYFYEYTDMEWEYFNRRCVDEDGWVKNPLTGNHGVIPALERMYSDSVHDTTFDFYGSDYDANVFRYNTKFNVLLPLSMLNKLQNGVTALDSMSNDTKQSYEYLFNQIDEVVSNVKQAEIDYGGTLKAVRFGVKLNEDGSVSYCATWGRKNNEILSADGTDELLEKLYFREKELEV